ncbi:MAG: hypothetical protein RL032_1401 [Pseudomonadota bacterium]|jgi:hypothetical protein
MSTLLDSQAPTSAQEQTVTRLIAGDTVVYVVLTALVWATWQVSQMDLFKAGDDVGYWMGVAGGVMMLLLFSYPLRKHFRFAHSWGKVKWWFLVHMLLGVGGPLLILLHSTFRIGSLNAGVALYSMLIVAGSGVVGRFIYARVNRGLRGEQTELKELQVRARMDQDDVRSRLAFAPRVEALLKNFEQAELQAKEGWITHLRRVFWLPFRQWWLYRQCVAELDRSIRALAIRGGWTPQERLRRSKRTKKMAHRYIMAVVRVAQYTAYARLFSLWHVAHIPFVYLLIISAIVHVVAVHAY